MEGENGIEKPDMYKKIIYKDRSLLVGKNESEEFMIIIVCVCMHGRNV